MSSYLKENAFVLQLVKAILEIIAVCSENYANPINMLCGQNVELLDVKLGGT
jgi:hypothetical protein